MPKEVMPYVDCPLKVRHKTGLDLTDATSFLFVGKKPSGDLVQRSGTREGVTDIVYGSFLASDIDESGLWQFQVIPNYSGVDRACKIQTQMVYDRLA